MTFVPKTKLMGRVSGCHSRHAIETAPSRPWGWPVQLRSTSHGTLDGTPQMNPACFLAVPQDRELLRKEAVLACPATRSQVVDHSFCLSSSSTSSHPSHSHPHPHFHPLLPTYHPTTVHVPIPLLSPSSLSGWLLKYQPVIA
ncbi:hypothetical protein ASPFODRAFT_56926 [Aspergillus luchuensis CBS 106.47]|uniref:Uncharacterized protein n=1 Tax=Aspergillus luchuensis (strain CBS 106.47) TaxID=1137211 RepID=A0A1M3TVD8_ASPLC|nr:hypothetical protein ASPFODRAFT_56926 [Aspergillus luchuensis CBS 106.47]